MKKMLALTAVMGLLSIASISMAASDLAVGDPVGSNGQVTHHTRHRHHHHKKHKSTSTAPKEDKAAAPAEKPAEPAK